MVQHILPIAHKLSWPDKKSINELIFQSAGHFKA